jgi:Flp pilus assembly protein TadD
MGDHLFREYFAALMYDEEEDYQSVIQSLTDHLVSNPSNAVAYNNRAVAYWEIGQTDRALADFAEAIRLAPDEAQPAKGRGMLRQRRGDLVGALADFDTAIRVAPGDPYLRRTRGHARAEAEQLAGAVDDFSRAIAVQPEFAQQYIDRAAVYERLGQPFLAEQDRVKASRLV